MGPAAAARAPQASLLPPHICTRPQLAPAASAPRIVASYLQTPPPLAGQLGHPDRPDPAGRHDVRAGRSAAHPAVRRVGPAPQRRPAVDVRADLGQQQQLVDLQGNVRPAGGRAGVGVGGCTGRAWTCVGVCAGTRDEDDGVGGARSPFTRVDCEGQQASRSGPWAGHEGWLGGGAGTESPVALEAGTARQGGGVALKAAKNPGLAWPAWDPFPV